MSRFAIKRSPLWRPLLGLFGATAASSWVEVEPDRLRARFGFYRLEIPRAEIAGAEPATWPFVAGIGWRGNFVSTLGLIGATSPVVRVRLRQKQRGRLLGLPLRFDNLYLSLEDPEGFIRALQR
jgi:hypothetical protein